MSSRGANRSPVLIELVFQLFHNDVKISDFDARSDRQNATMMLVGDVANRTAILVDDLADTSNTITRAAKLLKKEGAKQVYALITHGVYV